MKNLVLLLFLSLACLNSYSQDIPEFYISEIGFANTQDNEKDYIVYEISEKSATELYQLTLTVLSKIYRSPQKALSLVEGKLISINAYAENVMFFKHENEILKTTKTYRCSIDYTFIVEFKDDKIKFDSPEIHKIYLEGVSSTLSNASFLMALRSELEKNNILAEYFNQIIKTIYDYIVNPQEVDVW